MPPGEQEIEQAVLDALGRWFDVDPGDLDHRREIREAVDSLVKARRRRQARDAALPAELIRAGFALIGSAIVAWLAAHWNGMKP